MKRFFLLVGIFFLLLSPHAYADTERNIRLDNLNSSRTAFAIVDVSNTEICSVGFSLQDVDDDGNYTIEVSIENYHDFYYLYLFTEPYTAKELKKLVKPSVVYTKEFKEDIVKACTGVFTGAEGWNRIDPRQRMSFYIKGSEDKPSFQVLLPLYFAKKANCIFLYHKMINVIKETLNINVEIKPSYAYTKSVQDVDDLLKSISDIKYTVCNHRSGKKHHPSLEEQQAKTRKTLDSLKYEIRDRMPDVKRGSRRYREFEELMDRLDRFNLNSIPVVECDIPDRTCSCPSKIAAMTMEQMYRRIEEIYFDLQMGRVTKGQVMNEVNAIKTHSGHVSRDPSKAKNGILKYYNKIRNM